MLVDWTLIYVWANANDDLLETQLVVSHTQNPMETP